MILLAVAIVILIGLYLLIKFGKWLVVNAILGLIILIMAHDRGIGVPIDLITSMVSAIAGVPGAILVTLLYMLGVPV